MRWVGLLLAVSVFFTPDFALAGSTKVAVLDFTAADIKAGKAKALTENLGNIVAAEVARLVCDVMSSININAMLSCERHKDMLGGNDASCLAELGGALDSDLMIDGAIGRLGSTL